MSEYLIQGEALSAIADAIRAKNGSTDDYTPAQMANAIAAIESGGGGATLNTCSITNGTGMYWFRVMYTKVENGAVYAAVEDIGDMDGLENIPGEITDVLCGSTVVIEAHSETIRSLSVTNAEQLVDNTYNRSNNSYICVSIFRMPSAAGTVCELRVSDI